MANVTTEDQSIELQVLVVGGATGRLLSAIHARANAGAVLADAADPLSAPIVTVLPLGEIKGWKTSFRFHGYGTDPWAAGHAAAVDAIYAHIDGLVVCEADTSPSNDTMERLAAHWRTRAEPRPPAALLGTDAIAARWVALASEPAAVQGAIDSAEPFKSVSPLLKAALGALKR